VDVVELLVLVDVIGFDAVKALRVLQRSPQRRQGAQPEDERGHRTDARFTLAPRGF
jgi:hypothetical protein